MAVVKNKTGDVLSLFSPDAPPIDPGGEVTVRDEVFVTRAWPKEIWDLTTPPDLEGYVDASIEDAYLYVPVSESDPWEGRKPNDSWLKDDIEAWVAHYGIDVGGAKTKAEILTAIEKES